MRVDIESLSGEAMSVITNAICWAMFAGDGREPIRSDIGELSIECSDEEIARVRSAADRLLIQLALYEQSVAQENPAPWIESTHADVWAAQFLAHAALSEDPEFTTDEGNLIGWFANAIERGRDAGIRSVPCMTAYEIVRCHNKGLPVWVQFGTDGDATWELVTDELVATLTTDIGQMVLHAYVSPNVGDPTPEGS